VKNEDEKSVIQWSEDGGADSDQGLVFELNYVQIEQECENVGKVALSSEVQGVEDDVSECEQENEAKNVALSTVVEDDVVLKAADSFLATKDDPEDSSVSDVATYQLQEGMDVKAEESLKQPDFMSAQVNVIQDQIADINISRAANPRSIQYDCCGIDLVVDLNSNKNTQDDSVPTESVFSDVNYHVSDLVWGKVRGHPW